MIELASSGQGVVLREHDDGRVEVLEAPPVAEFTCALLGPSNSSVSVDEAGYLLVGGEVAYRPLRLRADLGGHLLLVCERVR